MKDKHVLIIILVVLLTLFTISFAYMYIKNNMQNVDNQNTENNIYGENIQNGLMSNVDIFLFTEKGIKLSYEGGPSHWGSRTVLFSDMSQTNKSKIVSLFVIDESDLKGEQQKKEWTEKWEATSEGYLYIDDVLMLKSPIVLNNEWTINNYKPVINSDKKYTANIKITKIEDTTTHTNLPVKKVYTTLTIKDITTVDGGIYTENRIFETGIGLRELSVTEPSISNLMLNYSMQRVNPIE